MYPFSLQSDLLRRCSINDASLDSVFPIQNKIWIKLAVSLAHDKISHIVKWEMSDGLGNGDIHIRVRTDETLPEKRTAEER